MALSFVGEPSECKKKHMHQRLLENRATTRPVAAPNSSVSTTIQVDQVVEGGGSAARGSTLCFPYAGEMKVWASVRTRQAYDEPSQAGGRRRKAPRHEIAENGAPSGPRALWGLSRASGWARVVRAPAPLALPRRMVWVRAARWRPRSSSSGRRFEPTQRWLPRPNAELPVSLRSMITYRHPETPPDRSSPPGRRAHHVRNAEALPRFTTAGGRPRGRKAPCADRRQLPITFWS